MDYREIQRLNKIMKMVRQFEDLRKTLDQIQDIRRQQQLIRHFIEEKKDQFWRGEKPSREELETLREKAGYDQKLWQEIVRELLGEPPPKA